MFYVQIKSDVFKENTEFWRQKRKYIHIYVYLSLCKRHNDYKCIEIYNQHTNNFKVCFLEKCEMVLRTL